MPTPETDKTQYQGWTNYETWLANLWLTNTEALHNFCHHLITTAPTQADAASNLNTYVTEQNPITEASLFSDLLITALDRIDWHEIVESFEAE